MAKNAELIVTEDVDVSKYIVVSRGVDQVRDVIEANVGSAGIGPFSLDKALNPSGKGTPVWEIPGIEDEPERTKEVEGIMVYQKDARSFWVE